MNIFERKSALLGQKKQISFWSNKFRRCFLTGEITQKLLDLDWNILLWNYVSNYSEVKHTCDSWFTVPRLRFFTWFNDNAWLI
jgi:hypothetical protein